MLNIETIIQELEEIRLRPQLHVQPVTPEALWSHLMSMTRGIMLTTDSLTSGDFINARREANKFCGWESRSCGPDVEMREKGIPEEHIIANLLDVECQMWKILRQWEKENLAKAGDAELQ